MELTEKWKARALALEPYIPMFLVFMSGVGFSIQALFVKVLAENGFYNSYEVVFFRGLLQTGIMSVMLLRDEEFNSGSGPPFFGATKFVTVILNCVLYLGSLALRSLSYQWNRYQLVIRRC